MNEYIIVKKEMWLQPESMRNSILKNAVDRYLSENTKGFWSINIDPYTRACYGEILIRFRKEIGL